MDLLTHYNYVVYVVLMMVGLYAVVAKEHLVKKLLGLSLFQTGIFVFYISMGVVDQGTTPITWPEGDPWRERWRASQLDQAMDELKLGPERRERAQQALARAGTRGALGELPELAQPERAELERLLDVPVTNPLPSVLILTAIVVSVSTMAVALALCIRIKESFGTLEAAEITRLEQVES